MGGVCRTVWREERGGTNVIIFKSHIISAIKTLTLKNKKVEIMLFLGVLSILINKVLRDITEK